MLPDIKAINASLFFYKKNEYLLPSFFDDSIFKYEGMNIKDNSISSFLEILSNYNNIQSIINNAINSIEKIEDSNLLNFICEINDDLIKIHKYFEIFNIRNEMLEYISEQEELLKNKKKSNEILIQEFLEDYSNHIYEIKRLVDIYYNVNNDVFLSKFSPEKRLFFSNAKRREIYGRLIFPKSQRFFCIEYKNKLIPPESFLPIFYDLYNCSKDELKNKDLEKLYNVKSTSSLEYKYISKHDILEIIVYDIHSFYDYLKAYYHYLTTNNIQLNKCKNCGKYFIPNNKVNETLCNNIFKNGKTCKQLSYELKLENDTISQIYRKAYKTQNAKKIRNSHIPNIDIKFKKWVKLAQEQKKLCYDKKISIEEFEKWLKNNQDWNLTK